MTAFRLASSTAVSRSRGRYLALRIQRTRESILKTFEKMICEMDYEQITVKELAQRARINRKIFYLHYNTLDDLLREIQNEMAQNFIKRTQ